MVPNSCTLQPPLFARNGRQLKIIAICRISTVNQDERSLSDQEAVYRKWVANHTNLPFDMEVSASQGSGECLDGAEYLHAIELVESRKFDLVITEDLGRICRRVHAHIFCENCEDHETRLIALNDHVDTGRDDWRLGSFFAVMRHETYNRDTSLRIRRSLRNRFSQGGVVQTTIFGYIKPPGTSTDDALEKDPTAEPIYDEWFRRLEEGATFSEIADWLNEHGVPTGPYTRSDRWSGTMVGQVTRNPIL
jgi:DNA invertase Pin-like site-specific DNA recombinase